MGDANGEAIPPGTYEALVRCLFDNLSTLAAGAVFSPFAVAAVALLSGSPRMWAFAAGLAGIGAGRVALSLAFRRLHPPGRASGYALRSWRLAYLAGANAFSLAFGLAALDAMTSIDDPVCHMILVTGAVGYSAGIAGRNSVCLEVGMSQLWSAMAPILAGFLIHGGAGYQAMAVTGLAFAAGVSRISHGLNRTLLGVYRISDEREALAARLDSAVATMRHGFATFGPDGRLEVCSGSLAGILRIPLPAAGCTMDDIVDACFAAGTRAVDGIMLRSTLRGLLRTNGHRTVELPLQDGRTLHVTGSPGSGGGCVLIVDDVTERLGAEAARAVAARLDPVTGLLNRAAMDAALEALLAEGRAVAAHFIDLDRFKPVNDTYGHGVGDALLKAVGERLSALVPEGAVAARLGGDEFVLLQEGSPEAVAALAEAAVRAIEAPFAVEGREISVSASVGTARAPADGTDPLTLMRNADTALYRVKESGRCGWRAYEPSMDAQRQDRARLEADLRQALAGRALSVAYQPQVDLDRDRVGTCEALVRWVHPTLGPIAPDAFIPLAEETGLINGVGRFVLEQACAEALRWPDHVSVAVNVSAVQFRGDIAGTVADVLAATGLPGRRLELEVTETVLMEDAAAIQASLLRLAAMGVRIALDDFGTGYSSLSYLRSFPFRKVKLDRSFVAGLGAGAESRAIIRAMAHLGRDLGMDVVVEGVETGGQLAAVREAGCTIVQGYLFSPPLGAEAVLERLAPEGSATRAA